MSKWISTAQARTKSALWGSQALGLRLFHCKFSRKHALAEILLNSSLRGPRLLLYRSDPGEILSKRSLHKQLAVVLLWKLVWEALVRILHQDVVKIRCSSSRSFYDILWAPLRGPGMKILIKVLYTSLCEDLVEILVKCCHRRLHDLVQVLVRSSWHGPGEILSVSLHGEKILWRSCWNPPQEILALRSWRCSAFVLLWKLFWDAHREFSYEGLVSSTK